MQIQYKPSILSRQFLPSLYLFPTVNSFSSSLSIGKCINQVSHILVLFQVVKKDLKCRASMPTQRWCPHFNESHIWLKNICTDQRSCTVDADPSLDILLQADITNLKTVQNMLATKTFTNGHWTMDIGQGRNPNLPREPDWLKILHPINIQLEYYYKPLPSRPPSPWPSGDPPPPWP